MRVQENICPFKGTDLNSVGLGGLILIGLLC